MTESAANQRGREAPLWLFPELAVALAPWEVRNVPMSANVATLLAVPNPRRIAIAFFTPSTDAVPTIVSPFSDPGTFGIPIPVSERYKIFKVEDQFALVGGQWYGFNSAGNTMRVVEFVKPSSGGKNVQRGREDQKENGRSDVHH